MGAIVATVADNGAASKAGMQPGDVIVQYNGRPIQNNDELVKMVVATKPGTTVPVKVLRNRDEKTLNVTVEELDLNAEQNGSRRPPTRDNEPPEEHGASGFGLTLEPVTPSLARRLQLPSGQTGAVITDVDPDGPAAGILRQGDVILSVNHRQVSSANEAARAAEGAVRPSCSVDRLARQQRDVRDREEGLSAETRNFEFRIQDSRAHP
jgi:serine protease Do